MKRKIVALRNTFLWLDRHKTAIRIVFSAVIALLGAEAVTEDVVFSQTVNGMTSTMVDPLIEKPS